jgi:AcrR family transcriptional regulator
MTIAAVELLEEHGPGAMTARKITARVGTSSMSVYTDFGSMKGLVGSVVDYGFGLLLEELNVLELTGHPLRDLWSAVSTLRSFALAHRHLYAVMFAAESLGGYERSGDELVEGVETLRFLHRICVRAQEDGHFAVDHASEATRQIWIVMHGHVMLDSAGYLSLDPRRAGSYADTIRHALIGLGASPEDARAAVQP